MTVHIIKLCVGVSDIQELADWQALRLAERKRVFHVTRMFPRRGEEIIGKGSIYWVIKGTIAVRQKIIDLEPFKDEDGIPRCRMVFDPQLVPVRPTPRRAFQGWRYLLDDDKPEDLAGAALDSKVPEKMRHDLLELGLI